MPGRPRDADAAPGSWVTYVRSGGQDEAVSLPCVQT